MHYVRATLPCFAICLLAVGAASRAAPPAPVPEQTAAAPKTGAAKPDPPRLGGPTAEGIEFFETHIRPVLVSKCYQCHSADSKILRGGLRLDTAERMQAGGESGPAVVPNKPEESLLISALRYQNYEMPPSGKLPDEVINNFTKWIAMGAPDPRSEPMSESEKAAKNKPKADPRDHWAYKHPQRTAPPQVAHTGAVRSDIDRFVLAHLESAKLSPSPQAPPRALYRRLYYDLTGLPRLKNSTPSPPIRVTPATKQPLTVCLPRPASANAGLAIGSTSLATPTPRAMSSKKTATTKRPSPIATG